MRAPRSLLVALSAPLLVVALAACVEPADSGKSKDTIAPLPTATSLTLTSTSLAVDETAAAHPSDTSGAQSSDSTGSGSSDSIATATTVGATIVIPTGPSNPYTIVANDTLFGIAKRCSISAASLAAFNAWTDGTSHSIHPGDVIKVPCDIAATTTTTAATTASSTGGSNASGATSTTVAGSTSTATTIAGDASSGGTYTVEAGDYLSSIAAKTGTTVDAIVAANGWTDGANHVIIPGQKIKLPVKQ